MQIANIRQAEIMLRMIDKLVKDNEFDNDLIDLHTECVETLFQLIVKEYSK